MDNQQLVKCNYCSHRGFKLRRNLLTHITAAHPEFLAHYETEQVENQRLEKRALDSVSADHIEKSAREAANKDRLHQQNKRQEVVATRLRSQAVWKASKDDVDAPALDEDGLPLTYHPNQVKSKTKRIGLGPRRTIGFQKPFTVVHPSAAREEDLPDVPEELRHAFDPHRPGFNPFHPFLSGEDFKKARFFIQSRMADSNITKYFNHGVGTSNSFHSPHLLHKLINEMEPALDYGSWTKGTATFIADKKNADQPFYFRDLEDTLRFLLEQPCFKDHITYYPVMQFSDADMTVREYGEPFTAQFWHQEQVSNFFHRGR